VSYEVKLQVQRERLMLTPISQVRSEQRALLNALLEPQTPFKLAHALTDIIFVKAAITARRNQKRMTCADVSAIKGSQIIALILTMRKRVFLEALGSTTRMVTAGGSQEDFLESISYVALESPGDR